MQIHCHNHREPGLNGWDSPRWVLMVWRDPTAIPAELTRQGDVLEGWAQPPGLLRAAGFGCKQLWDEELTGPDLHFEAQKVKGHRCLQNLKQHKVVVGNQLFKKHYRKQLLQIPWWWWEAGGLLAERTSNRQHCTGGHTREFWVGTCMWVPPCAPCATCHTPGNQTAAWKQGKKQIFPLTLAQPQSCSCAAVCDGAVVIQELVHASSEPGKSEYFSRWEMVERTCWLFICFLVLWWGFSLEMWEGGSRWFKHMLKDAISVSKTCCLI